MNIRFFYPFFLIVFSSIHVQANTPYANEIFATSNSFQDSVDAMTLQYCELEPDSHILAIFPSAVGYDEEAEQIIGSYAEIVYKKSVLFTPEAGLNFLLTAYENNDFIFSSRALRRKMRLCFPKKLVAKNPMRVYVVRCESLELMKQCKADIRAMFKIGKHSVHSTDTQEEAIILSRFVFNCIPA